MMTSYRRALLLFNTSQTAQQYEEFVDKFNRKIRERKTALNNISSRLNGKCDMVVKCLPSFCHCDIIHNSIILIIDQKSSNGKTDDVSETNKGSGSTYYVGPSLSGSL